MSSSIHRVTFFAALMLDIALCAQSGGPKLVHQEEFSVVGVEARTSAERELSGEGEIPGLWEDFYHKRILEKIPNKADPNIYALYTDYSHDRMGEYTVVIGARVKDKSEVPAGMVLKTVPGGQYAVLTSEKGPAESVIPAAWQKVWALEDNTCWAESVRTKSISNSTPRILLTRRMCRPISM